MSKKGRRNQVSVPRTAPIEKIPFVDMSSVKVPVMKVFNPFRVRPLPDQPRKRFIDIQGLTQSIQVLNRQLVPVLVTEVHDDPNFDAQLVDGECRLSACCHLRRPIIAYIWDGETDKDSIYEAAVASNNGSKGHDALEILGSIIRLKKAGRTSEQIAAIYRKTPGWVGQHYLLRKLHPTIQNWIVPSVIDAGVTNNQPQKNGEPKTNLSMATIAEKRVNARHVKPTLSVQLALPLTKVPREKQLEHGREIVSRKMSLAEARRYIDSVLHGLGIRTRQRPIAESTATLLSVTGSIRHQLGKYTDMPFANLNRILAGMKPADLSRLNASLENIISTATNLQNDVQRQLSPSAGQGMAVVG